jgi:DNA-binding NarL/FixJ family response regulator
MRRRTNGGWTPEHEAVLCELAAKGKTALQIGLRLRRSQSGIKKRASYLGLKLGRTRLLPYSERVGFRT